MVARLGPKDVDLVIKFGSGLHTIASEDEIDDREAADGQNFVLDLEQHSSAGHSGKARELRPRSPFDLVVTAPNAGSIRGGGSLLKADGTVQAFIQAGNTVYELVSGSSFEASPTLDTVNASARLRGHWWSHNWTLDDKLIVTDLAMLEPVKDWNGTTWADISFQSGVSVAFGTFIAKYCSVANDRALFGHVKDSSGTLPHVLVGSAREDHTTISVSNRPSSSIGESDPFYLTTPDLKPINGLVQAFRALILSTEKGRIFNLAGESSQDYSVEDFFPGSAASGEESICYAGNDVIYGRQGRIESIRNVDQFGNTEADDLTRWIVNKVQTYTGWTIVFNSRLNRIYAFPEDQSEVWVAKPSGFGGEASPWVRWTTAHALAFQPTFVDSMLDPSDGLEYVFMGDSSGNLYRMEGTSHDGDGGSTNIEVEYLTKMFSLPVDSEAYDVQGYIRYRTDEAVTVQMIFEYAGKNVFTQSLEITMPAATGVPYWGGFYWSNGTYWSAIRGRLKRQKFRVAGKSNEFQVRIKVSSQNHFAINEIGLRFTAATK